MFSAFGASLAFHIELVFSRTAGSLIPLANSAMLRAAVDAEKTCKGSFRVRRKNATLGYLYMRASKGSLPLMASIVLGDCRRDLSMGIGIQDTILH